MQITKVEKQEKRDRYNVFADGKFLTALDGSVVVSGKVREGEIFTQTELTALLERDRFAKALNKAYSILARRPHAAAELKRKLADKGYATSVTDEAVVHLEELGYVNDREFARQWVGSRGATRGQRLLRAELRQRGVAEAVVDAVLAESVAGDGNDLELLAAKRLGRYREKPWEEARDKTVAFLVRRGYGFAEARSAVERSRPTD